MPFLTHQPIALDPLLHEVASPQCGGTCVFLGTVRSGPGEPGGVTGIEYSGYEAMVEQELGRVLAQARERWPLARVTLQHRLGWIPVGQASIAIVAAAPHRAEAFDACRYVIEAVKQCAPIWKKELQVDGTATWAEPS